MTSATVQQLTRIALKFRTQRQWEQFHTPKDLAADLVVEAGELLELMLWKNGSELLAQLEERKEHVADEMADVLHALVLLAHDLKVDLGAAFKRKMRKNRAKYPIHMARGSARKYTEYQVRQGGHAR